MQLFFHGRITQVSPQLQAVDAQYGLDGGRWTTTQCLVYTMRKGEMSVNTAAQGTTWFTASRKTTLRFFLVSGSRPSAAAADALKKGAVLAAGE